MAGGLGSFQSVSWWDIPGLLRAAVRSPFYRAERRQGIRVLPALGGTGLALLIFVAVGLVCCAFFPLVLGGLTALLPGFIAAEGLVGEIEADTLDSLLLTPAERAQVLWAKLAARLRGWTAMVVAVVLLGTPVLFGLMGFLGVEPGTPDTEALVAALVWGCAGLAAGTVGAVLAAGQALTGGALAMATVLHQHGRASTYTIVSLAISGLTLAESLVWGMTAMILLIANMLLAESGSAEPWVAPSASVLVLLAVFGVRVLVLNWLMPALLMRHAAANMDRLLLVGR